MDILQKHLTDVRIPTDRDKIWKDECVLSFDTPDSPRGIYICLNTFLGFSHEFVKFYHLSTGKSVFLNIRRIAHPAPKAEAKEDEEKPKRLALNVEGGFNTNEKKYEYEELNRIIVMPGFQEIALDSPELPEVVILSVSTILSADSASRKEEIEAAQGTWDGEKREVSKFGDNLVQLNNGVQIPTSGWKCAKCDITQGLWLNLTDGMILCGRKNFDGSGGNNHAAEHYEQTKYPLAVKLGTITPESADVYSYPEDNMVIDRKLQQHLAHFGIIVDQMSKTEKTMIEMEIELNKNYNEWSIIQEDGCKLKSLFGPGFTGMANLGNSCYMNSIVQVLFSVPDFVKEFYRKNKNQQFNESTVTRDPAGDLRTQLMKLASGLLSGEYSISNENLNEQTGIRPTMFKHVIGRNHPEFMSKRQQDAQEFFLHAVDQIERLNYTSSSSPPTDAFKFQIEERVQCGASDKVKYTNRADFVLSLPISGVPIQNQKKYEEFNILKAAVEAKGEKVANEDVVRPIVKLEDCIQAYMSDVIIEDFYSQAVNKKTFAKMRTRLNTFPDYLWIHMKKFTLGEDWTPKKLDVHLDVPEILDLEALRGHGKLPNEVEMPDGPAKKAFEFDEAKLQELSLMGFDINGCKRALFATKNSGIEQATNWILEHMGDSDFSAPFSLPAEGSAGSKSSIVHVNSEALEAVTGMGIDERQAILALKMNNNNTERAIEWIFANIDRIPEIEREQEQKERAAAISSDVRQSNFRDGPGKYELVAMVSHMGSSTLCGHYVCHIKKRVSELTPRDGDMSPSNVMETDNDFKWTIFNDNKVAISERPPIPYAYMYLFKRIN